MAIPPEIRTLLDALQATEKALSGLSLPQMSALRRFLSDPDQGPDLAETLQAVRHQLQELMDFAGQGVASPPPAQMPLPTPQAAPVAPASASAPAKPVSAYRQPPRRKPSKAFDFTIYKAILVKRKGRPVGQRDLFDLLSALDERTKRESLTAKLNRMKSAGYIDWDRADDISVTDPGASEATRLARYLEDEEFDRIKAAFAEAWDMDVTLR